MNDTHLLQYGQMFDVALRLYPHFQHLSRTSCFYLSFRYGKIAHIQLLILSHPIG
jgi:hypothetical protein